MEQKYISYAKFHKLDLQMVELTKIIKIFLFLFFSRNNILEAFLDEGENLSGSGAHETLIRSFNFLLGEIKGDIFYDFMN